MEIAFELVSLSESLVSVGGRVDIEMRIAPIARSSSKRTLFHPARDVTSASGVFVHVSSNWTRTRACERETASVSRCARANERPRSPFAPNPSSRCERDVDAGRARNE